MLLENFRSWCTARGIQSQIDICQRHDGNRYAVLSPQAKDAKMLNLLEVPLQSCLVADNSEQLADRLEFEKNLGEQSEFAPFIDLFPPLESFQNDFPRFWKPDRLAKVEAADGGALTRAVEADEPRVNSPFSDPWALACVDSRSHFLPDKRFSLTPVLDMINHCPSVSTHIRTATTEADQATRLLLDVERDTLPQTKTISWIERLLGSSSKDEEIFISYGDFSNVHTLINYGFVEENNSVNTEDVEVKLIRESPVNVRFRRDGTIDDSSLPSLTKLRQFVACTEERDILKVIPKEDQSPLLYVSPRNEEEVFALLAGELDIAIDKVRDGLDVTQDDVQIQAYLRGRLKVLEAAFAKIREKFPQVLQ